MNRLIYALVLTLVLAGDAKAQKFSIGGCVDVPVKENLDIQKYTGHWYEIEKNPASFEAGLKCSQANYGYEGDYVSVVNKGVSESTGKEISVQGKATIPDKNVPAKLKVKFDNIPFSADYWVLDTDYEQYSVVYSCLTIYKFFTAEHLWILSRTPTLDDNIKQNIYKLLDNNKISRTRLFPTKQDC